MTRMHTVRYLLWAAAALALMLAAVVFWNSSRAAEPSTNAVAMGVPFSLVADTGETVTDADLQGHPSLMFFGFTHCPDVCPTSLAQASAWIDALGPEGHELKVYFVTVDPARDTQPVMASYLSSFHPDITGLTGPVDDVHAMLDAYHIYYAEAELEDGSYLMNHTTSFYVLDDHADFIGTIGTMEGSDAAMTTLRHAIED